MLTFSFSFSFDRLYLLIIKQEVKDEAFRICQGESWSIVKLLEYMATHNNLFIYIQPKLPFSTPPWHRELRPITNGYGLLGKFCVSRVYKAHLCNAENRPDSVPLVSILTAGRVNVKYKNNKNKNQTSLERNGKYSVNLPLEKRLFL